MNIDDDGTSKGGHSTRTLLFDPQGRLYISVGSYSNVDENSFRSRIRRFDGMLAETPGVTDFVAGKVREDHLMILFTRFCNSHSSLCLGLFQYGWEHARAEKSGLA